MHTKSVGVLLVVLVISALTGWTSGQQSTQEIDGFVARTYALGAGSTPCTPAPQATRNREPDVRDCLPYRLFVPKGRDKAKRYPLIVWLHGLGGRGIDNVQQLSGDQVAGTRAWISRESQGRHPAFVVAPQSIRAWQLPMDAVDLQPEPSIVVGLLDALGAEFPIDRRRVYLVAQSMGAGAAWNLVTNAPDRFAAVLLCCPAGVRSLSRAAAAAPVPLWAFEGALGSGPYTRNVIEALEQRGGHPKFTVYPDAGHDIWNRVFAEPAIVEWLFAQSR
jgi:predicted peptidase